MLGRIVVGMFWDRGGVMVGMLWHQGYVWGDDVGYVLEQGGCVG